MAYCSRCGSSLEENVQFCPNCGAPVETSAATPPTPPPPPSGSSPPPSWSPPESSVGGAGMPMQRPMGVTILAILAIIGGVISLLGGLALFFISSFVGASGIGTLGGSLVSGIVAAFGAVLIIIALIEFAGAYGFWTGKGWAWWLGIIVAVLDLISIINFPTGIISFLIGIVIIYYLTRPYVKAWFHRM